MTFFLNNYPTSEPRRNPRFETTILPNYGTRFNEMLPNHQFSVRSPLVNLPLNHQQSQYQTPQYQSTQYQYQLGNYSN